LPAAGQSKGDDTMASLRQPARSSRGRARKKGWARLGP
jgi:hypothetical protein